MKHFSSFRIIGLFCLSPLILSAQESDLFKRMLRETLRSDIPLNFSLDFSDPIFLREPIRLDAIKHPLPSLGFDYKLNYLLLSYKEEQIFPKPKTISPFLTAPYTNQKKYDPNSTETTGDVIANVVLYPIGSIVMLNPLGLFDYLMRAGVLPSEPFVPKKSKKERTLKTITQDVYHIDDNY